MNSRFLSRAVSTCALGAVLSLGASAASAEDFAALEVTGYVNDPLAEFSANGDFLGEIPKANMPRPDQLRVLNGDDDLGLIQVQLADRSVWIDRADVELSRLKRPNAECTGLKIARPADSSALSAMGVGDDC